MYQDKRYRNATTITHSRDTAHLQKTFPTEYAHLKHKTYPLKSEISLYNGHILPYVA